MIENTEQTIAESEGYRLTIQLFGPELTHIALRLYAGDEEIFNNVSPLQPTDQKMAQSVASLYGAAVLMEVPQRDHEEVLRLFSAATAVLAQQTFLPGHRQ